MSAPTTAHEATLLGVQVDGAAGTCCLTLAFTG